MTATILEDLSQASKPDPARQYTSVDQLYDWLRPEVPRQAAQGLLDYAQEHGLVLTPDHTDIYPVRAEDGSWSIMVRWSGIERICRATGLWLPGKSDLKVISDGLYAFASCYVRPNRQSHEWCEVSAVARFTAHCDRDFEGKDPSKPTALGDWRLIPDIRLDEVAQYKAAVKALGDYVGRHQFMHSIPRILVHADYQERQRAAPAGATGR
jgi:hypothetical protein